MEQATILRTETVEINSIHTHPKNARKGNTQVIEKSLREHGQYAPVIVHEPTGYILKGNHTHQVMRDKIGASHIEATFVNCTEERALAILAVDNKSSDGAGYDERGLLALLEELDGTGLLGVSGYETDDLDDLLAKFEEDLPDVEEETEPPLLGESRKQPDGAATAPTVDTASGIQPAKSLAELGKQYDQQATRMMLLNYPIKQFTYAVEKLGELAEKHGFDNNADTILKLISDATGTAIPDAE